MYKDNTFALALIISLATHSAILLQGANISFLHITKKAQKIEVNYVKETKEIRTALRAPLPKREPFLKLPENITIKKNIAPAFIDKDSLFTRNKENTSKQADYAKPSFAKADVIAIKKKISLPPIDLDKINNPSYVSYYQIVREKIKRSAYQNYSGTEEGEVTISFVISNAGYLKDLRLVEEKSSSNPYLRESALKSVNDASPFPGFPKDLDFPSLSFNLSITFEIE